MGYSLSSVERQVLYKKYRSENLSSEEANARIDKIKVRLRELVESLKAKNKTKEEINKRFKAEFEKLAQSY